MEKSAFMKALLKIVGVLGVSLVMSGVLDRMFPVRVGLIVSQMVSSHQLSLSWVPFRGMLSLQSPQFDSLCQGSLPYSQSGNCSTQHHLIHHCRLDLRHLDRPFPHPTFRHIKDWKRFCTNCYYLAHVQFLFWHLRKLPSFIWLIRFKSNRLAKNLVHFDHSVLKAFSPYFAGAYFVRNKTDGWRSLGGILLAFTGVEALFADLGAFTMV